MASENESEVIERVEALPDRYAGRVRPQDLDGMRSMADGGEWQELVDALIDSLAHDSGARNLQRT
jgi:hypothetical protein